MTAASMPGSTGVIELTAGQTVIVERHGPVLLATIANPPVNALSIGAGVVAGLVEVIAAAERDPDVGVIAVRGAGRDFSAGADIRDFEDAPEQVDRLRDLFAAVAGCAKPVVAILHGNVLGGGLELALAAHFRVASADARLGLPEVNLGLLPGGGGTQRLPRIVGVAAALDMMLGGVPIAAQRAQDIGLVDAMVEEQHVLEWASASIGSGSAGNTGPADADAAAIETWRAQVAKRRWLGSARRDIIDCVEVATRMDLTAGLAFEREKFGRLLVSEPSRALRHAFFAERKVGRLPGVQTAKATPVTSAAVIGAGTMGSGIALALASAGLPVTLIEANEVALAAGLARIAAAIDNDVAKGRLDAEAGAARRQLVVPGGSIAACTSRDLVIEAVFEDIEVKRAVFQEIDRHASPSAILATNTSTLDVDAIAAATARPGRVVGLHFFSPANVMRLVEVVRGGATTTDTIVAALDLVRRIGKVGVVAGNCDGFIGNRIFEEYLRQAYWLLEEGALPAQVDAALEKWGMAMGPCRTMDLAGQDIGWSIRKRRALTQPDRPYSKIPDLLCEMGRFGQKTGAGYYQYPDGRTAQVDPAIDDLIVHHSSQIGVVRREIADEEIVERCLLAMIGEGAKILAEGIAARPLDIDVIYLNGYGFSAERGGPMFQADVLGLPHILDRMAQLRVGREGWAFARDPFLEDLAARGGTFATLNG